MISAYSTAQVRAAEALALQQDTGSALMRRAAFHLAGAVVDRLDPVVGRRVLLLVGPGNNGGDALFAGAVLRSRGVAVGAVLADPGTAHRGGLAALRRAGGRVLADTAVAAELAAADVVVDGLLGLGARPEPAPAMAALLDRANAAPGLKVAVDLPTGVHADTGWVQSGAFRADLTVTFGGMKSGLLVAQSHVGQVVVVDLGFAFGAPDLTALTDLDVTALLPDPGAADDKFSGGVPGIVAGSPRYPGAAILSVGGAVRTRPGMVRYAGPQATAVVTRWPEVVAASGVSAAGQVQAWVVGPGIGTDADAAALLQEVLATDVPVLVDADALTVLAGQMSLLAGRRSPTLLTPHGREFARLFPDLEPADRLRSVRAAAARSGATVLLKGSRTLIAEPDGAVAVNTTGSAWLATAGSGDVLSGIIGSLLAGGLPPGQAAAVGAHLHGRAGERAMADAVPGAEALWERIRVAGR